MGGRGGIGRHDGLKIRCLVIVREGSSPSVPIIIHFIERILMVRFISHIEYLYSNLYLYGRYKLE